MLTLHILSAALPAQSVHFTQWFHVDSIAEAYHVPVYSEAHWELIGKYMQMARYLGIDTILTPMLTPSLDTLIGGERLCVQLVQIEKHGERYAFDFSWAARYIDLAHENRHSPLRDRAPLFPVGDDLRAEHLRPCGRQRRAFVRLAYARAE